MTGMAMVETICYLKIGLVMVHISRVLCCGVVKGLLLFWVRYASAILSKLVNTAVVVMLI